MSDKEIKLSDYVQLPYHRFIMTRMEFLIFTQNEQKAKILRTIEWAVENERGRMHARGQKVPEIVFAAISHKFMLEQLMGTIQSETTLKGIISDLERDHFIFRRNGAGGPYDPPLYTLNKHLMATLAALLPQNLDDIDMMAIMKQERQVKKTAGGQLLTPSKIDPLVLKIRGSIIDPLDPQLLTLYGVNNCPPPRSTGGQLLTPKREEEDSLEKERKKETASISTETQPATDSLSLSLQKSSLQATKTPIMDPYYIDDGISAPTQQSGTRPIVDTLTEEQAAFWSRWCAIAKVAHGSLNATGLKHVQDLASKATTTQEVQSLYDVAYDRIAALCASNGSKPVPPQLGNLVKAYSDWSQERGKKIQQQEAKRQQRDAPHFSPGSGQIRHLTQERLAGNAPPPLVYKRLEVPTIKTGSISKDDFAFMLERFKQKTANQ